jgi:small subunit ribosomal protein S2
MPNVTMRQMLEAGVHFGHQTRYWNPKMARTSSAPAARSTSSTSKRTLPLLNDAIEYRQWPGQPSRQQ